MEKVTQKIKSVDELIYAINYIMENSQKFTIIDNGRIIDDEHPEVEPIVVACSNILLDDNGWFKEDAAKAVMDAGYIVGEFGKYHCAGKIKYSDKGFIAQHGAMDAKCILFSIRERSEGGEQYPKIVEGPSFETFVSTLNNLFDNTDGLLFDEKYEDGDLYNHNIYGKRLFNGNLEEVANVASLCNGFLISSGGECNWDNIAKLKEHGFRVYAGEKDSFGWLTGCVEKNGTNLVLVYG